VAHDMSNDLRNLLYGLVSRKATRLVSLYYDIAVYMDEIAFLKLNIIVQDYVSSFQVGTFLVINKNK